jgi:dipeptidase
MYRNQTVSACLLAALLGFLFPLNHSVACTNFLVTRGASVDGSTMISYAADSHIRYGELYFRPAANWPAGSTVTLYDRGTAEPLGSIPQVAHTYQTIGFMNEHQLAIGETTFGGRGELVDTMAVADYGSLMFLALQRARTAREAIRVIAELVEAHGYASTGESFSIGDPNEVWIMEIIGKGMELKADRKTGEVRNTRKGAVWVAVRIPDGYVSAHANHARITGFPLENGSTSISSRSWDQLDAPGLEVIYAHDVISFARSAGYFAGLDASFSFSDVYAPLDFGAARFCELRVWSFFNKVSDGMERYRDYATGSGGQERMPLYIKPERKLSARDIMQFKRDYLQGTDLDMSLDAGAGPFGLPYRWRPLTWSHGEQEYFNERVTATQQTGFSFIAQMRSWLPDPVGGIFWFGVDDAGTTVYVPFYCAIDRIPASWAEGNGDILSYSDDAAFWVFNRVAHFAYLFYNRVMVDVRVVQDELEGKFIAYTGMVDTAALTMWHRDPALARAFLTDYSCRMAEHTVQRWKKLGEFLLVKYLDGNIKHEKDGEFLRNPWGYPLAPQHPGYSDTWKETVVEQHRERFLVPE